MQLLAQLGNLPLLRWRRRWLIYSPSGSSLVCAAALKRKQTPPPFAFLFFFLLLCFVSFELTFPRCFTNLIDVMGSSLDKPSDRHAVCPLCHCESWDQITLECGHGFCRKCVKELWSGASAGPYYCLECDHEIRKLPDFFGETDGASTSTGTRLSTDLQLVKLLYSRVYFLYCSNFRAQTTSAPYLWPREVLVYWPWRYSQFLLLLNLNRCNCTCICHTSGCEFLHLKT